MSNEVKKGTLFIKEVAARIKGDDAEAQAAKISRKALSAVEGQIAALKAKEVDLENSLEDAVDALNNAKFPIVVFTNNQNYINNIKTAQNNFDTAKEELESVRESITYFNSLLDSF